MNLGLKNILDEVLATHATKFLNIAVTETILLWVHKTELILTL
jgi:hypothetical protein